MDIVKPARRKTPILPPGTDAKGAVEVTSAPAGIADLDPAAFDVMRHMRVDILSGAFEPGQRLKIEELRARYDASVGSLREALLQLMADGLVRSEMNRGFTVAPVSLADLMDITERRIAFEVQALTDSIRHGDDAWEAEIVSSLHLLMKLNQEVTTVPRSGAWPARHRRFHQALVANCRSPWLLHFRATLFDQAERYRSLGRTLRRARDVNMEHQQLADAVLARNVTKACDLAEKHIRRTVEHLTQAQKPAASRR